MLLLWYKRNSSLDKYIFQILLPPSPLKGDRSHNAYVDFSSVVSGSTGKTLTDISEI